MRILIAAAALCMLAACGSSEDTTKASNETAADSAAATGESAEGVQSVSFKVDNATTHTLTHLFISPAASDTWNRDILGDQTAAPGATIDVTIDDDVESCMYDFRAHFDNDADLDVRGIDVCKLEGQTVTVSENAG
ncbi:hypothetical protein ACETK8_09865 [Brevundimonas staleyi]|uniref:Argininosuccinate lyase n=1 Tax=Brevundimonas staleyi TaxID=74326 RepID=A0ABW0FP70_9CAUL